MNATVQQKHPFGSALRRHVPWGLPLSLGLLAGIWLAGQAEAPTPPEPGVAGLSREEALRLGERLYREGLLPSGDYVPATLHDEFPVDGQAFHCMSCHLRSGLGASDGNIIKLPVTGPFLFKPYPKEQALLHSTREDIPEVFRSGDVRPAYTRETLARAIRQGISAAGITLNAAMPRYTLSDRDMDILVYYLANLNREISPGVDGTSIRLATVITAEVPEADRRAMLSVLEAYLADRLAQSRHEERRAAHGSFDMERMYQTYRRPILDRWELSGPPETWRGQLEKYYAQAPVFALVGGISTLDWRPIHEFCEQNRIPCLFPVTDLPVISDNDFYTLYLSRGLYQEGATAANYLAGLSLPAEGPPVLQVFREGIRERRLAAAFTEAWHRAGRKPPLEMVLPAGQAADAEFWRDLVQKQPNAIILAWLGGADLAGLVPRIKSKDQPQLVFASSSLLGDDLGIVPAELRSIVYVTFPYNLPQDPKRSLLAIKFWLRARDIAFERPIIQSNMYFLGWMMSMALMDMRNWYYRDFFLEVLDMSRDQDYAVGAYPRLSFGVGQRYASKGCYVVQLADGPKPELIKRSEWVIH